VVKRPRPTVTQLDQHLPTSAYPSGHEAATCCLYVAIAILVIGHARGWWRWLFLIPAIAMPVLVALSRMYRGEHHPTDILASLLFSGLWLTATVLLIKPNGAEVSSHEEQTARAEAGTTVRSAQLLCRHTRGRMGADPGLAGAYSRQAGRQPWPFRRAGRSNAIVARVPRAPDRIPIRSATWRTSHSPWPGLLGIGRPEAGAEASAASAASAPAWSAGSPGCPDPSGSPSST
jgi:undecaprenyl-diphosphatase